MSTIPFEYESKEKFVFDVLEKLKQNKDSNIYPHVVVFDNVLYEEHMESLEHKVFTVEEFFEQFKEHIVIS